MNPNVLFPILAVLLLTNALIIYFTFSTWYGQKRSNKVIPVWYDDDGNIRVMTETHDAEYKESNQGLIGRE